MKYLVLGAGLVGSAIALDLAMDKDMDVTAADVNQTSLDKLKAHHIKVIHADLSDLQLLKNTVMNFDIIVGALPGIMGFETLKSIIESGKNVVDVSFFPEDPFKLDKLANDNNVTAVVDCGVAPGFSSIILGHLHSSLDKIESYTCYVGGLPVIRDEPLEYKSIFSPIDVIDDYTTPARFVVKSNLVIRPALSDPEILNFPGIGSLEAFNLDGLRTLTKTFPDIPDKIEKTLRYPGHIEKMKLLMDLDLFSHEIIEVKGVKVKPIDLTTKLMLPKWKLEEGEEDLIVMQIIIKGEKQGKKVTYCYDMLDRYDRKSKTTSMARTTGYTCSIVTRLVAKGVYKMKGISPPEYIGENSICYSTLLKELKKRDVTITETIEDL
ncbi:MAG: Lysine 6-dehydrogenase [Candidatus Heimdallarchaeota archaeon LC_3]|nr:MAG: Lysine 6-dehydrogenase [Candidatus Heimdallarchaeota archaeon LC_3]OLS23403.1 MAG: Lysine 6-dehydrogenase [Candidatus Heimdallarchaeota archaeon LC_3]